MLIILSSVLGGYLFSLIVPWKRKSLVGLTIFDQVKDKAPTACPAEKI
jgi:hypothetical protein